MGCVIGRSGGGEGRNGISGGDAMIEITNLFDATVNAERKPITLCVVVNLRPLRPSPLVAINHDCFCFVLFHRQEQTTPDRIVQQNSQTVFIHALKRSARTVQAFVQQFY
jgi:hypothetical protein